MIIPAASARMAVEFFGSPVIAGVSCSSGSPPVVSGMLLCQEALAQAKRPTAETLQVVASTCTPPRTRTHSSTHSATRGTVRALAAAVTRRKGKRRRSGGSSGSDDSGEEEGWPYDPYSLNWGGPGDTGGFGGFSGGSGGSYGRGGSNNNGPYMFRCSEWDFFGNTLYEGMWVWQLICAVSLMQALHFLLCPKAQEGLQEGEGIGVAPVGC